MGQRDGVWHMACVMCAVMLTFACVSEAETTLQCMEPSIGEFTQLNTLGEISQIAVTHFYSFTATDIIYYFESADQLAMNYYDSGRSFQGPYAVTSGGDSENLKSLVAYDMTGQGLADLIYEDQSAGGGIDITYAGSGLDPPTRLYSAPDVAHIGVGDFNGDGCPDIAFCTTGGTVAWLECTDNTVNAVTMNPTPHVLQTTTQECNDLRVADVDSDGNDDIVMTVENFWEWYRSYGNGSFAPGYGGVGLSLGNDQTVTVADFTGDGVNEVVVCTFTHGTLTLFERVMSTNDTVFSGRTLLTDQHGCIDVHHADMDGDGDLDIVWGDNDGFVYWLANHGDGNWNTREQPVFASFYNTRSIAIGDVDGNGHVDVAVGSRVGTSVVWNPGPEAGLFPQVSTQSYAVQGTWSSVDTTHLVDLNADSVLDLIVVSRGAGTIDLLPGASGGAFGTALQLETGMFSPDGLDYADYNNDGLLDIVCAINLGFGLRVLRNEGNGEFSEEMVLGANQLWGTSYDAHWADFDQDGHMDAVGVFGNSQIKTFKNNGIPPLGTSTTLDFDYWETLYVDAYGLAIVDINLDGYPDMFSVDLDWSVRAFVNLGNGTFGATTGHVVDTTWPRGRMVACGDITGDGYPDCCVSSSNTTHGGIRCYRNDAPHDGQSWSIVSTNQSFPGTWGIHLRDINADGHLDIALGHTDGTSYLRGDGTGQFTDAKPMAGDSVGVTTIRQFAVEDIDGDGDLDSTFNWDSGTRAAWAKQSSTFREWPRPDSELEMDVSCGMRMSCIVEAISRQASICSADTLLIPPGTYRVCFQRVLPLIRKSLTLKARDGLGSVIWDCEGEGGLFHVTDGAEVTIEDIEIRNPSTAVLDINGGTPLRVSGDTSTLTLRNVKVDGASSVIKQTATSQFLPGMGGLAVVVDGAGMSIYNSTFRNCVAGISGGVVAISGTSTFCQIEDSLFEDNEASEDGGVVMVLSGATVVDVTRSQFLRNTAVGGHGGVIATSEAGSPHVIHIDESLFEDNTASTGIGGVLYQVTRKAEDLPLPVNPPINVFQITNSVVRRCHALFGGALALLTYPSPFLGATGSLTSVAMNRATEMGVITPNKTHVSSLWDQLTVEDCTADYGAIAFICQVPTNVTRLGSVSGNTAARSGGAFFTCLPEAATAGGLAPSAQAPWLVVEPASWDTLTADGAVSAAQYGRLMGSSPAAMTWSGEAPSFGAGLGSGVPLGSLATVRMTDWFGQSVIDENLLLEISLQGAGSNAVTMGGASARQVAASASVSFAASSLVMKSGFVPPEATPGIQVAIVGADSQWPSLATDAITVTACPPGYGRTSEEGQALVCSACGLGSFSNTTSTDPCETEVSCPDNSIAFGTQCIACPENTVRNSAFLNVFNATTNPHFLPGIAPCMCLPGFWAPSGAPDEDCVTCPVGGVCHGDLRLPVAAPGYYPTSNPTLFIECPRSASCEGEGRCEAGYTARLCAECASGYYQLGDTCHRCDGSRVAFVVMALVLIVFCVLAGIVWFNTRENMNYRFAAVMIGFNSLQISAIYGKLDLDWGEFAEGWFDVISALNLNLDLASPECAAASGVDIWMFKWWMTMLLPVFGFFGLAVIYGLALLLMNFCSHRMPGMTVPALTDATIRSAYQILVLLYLPLTAMNLAYFGCHQESDGRWRMDAAPSRTCYTANYWAVFPFAVIFCVLYCALIPALIGYLLWTKQEELNPIAFTLKYGFLVARFEDDQFLFEVAIMVRKLAVVIAMTAFASPHSGANLAILALAACLVHLCVVEPYRARLHNYVAVLALSSCTCILLAGTFPDHTMRIFWVIVAILANMFVIFGGTALDIRRIMKQEKDCEDEVLATDSGFFNTGGAAAVDVGGANVGSFASNTELSIMDDASNSESFSTMNSVNPSLGTLSDVQTVQFLTTNKPPPEVQTVVYSQN